MKKLLSVLASLSVVASSATTVLACSDNSVKKEIPESPETIQAREESVDKLKAYILADQYGLDLQKTKERIGNDVNEDTNGFGDPDSDPSVTKDLKLNGNIGKDNQPIYDLIDQLKPLLDKLKVNTEDAKKDVSMLGDSLAPAIGLIMQSPTINGVTQLIPFVLTMIKSLNILSNPILDWGPDQMGLIGEAAKKIATIVGDFDLNSDIAKFVGTEGKTVAEISEFGVKELDYVVNDILFRHVDVKDEGDVPVSKWLGEKVLTPLLNKKHSDNPTEQKEIDDAVNKQISDAANEIFNKKSLEGWVVDLFNHGMNFVASLVVQLTLNLNDEVMNLVPKDADHLFGDDTNEKVFGKNDNVKIKSTDGKTLVTDDSKQFNLSLDKAIFGTINLLSDEDENKMSILKLTNIIFHDQYDMSGKRTSNNQLLDKLSYWIIDALKFTDYEVKIQKHIDGIPVLKSIDLDIDFKLSQLFEPGTPVSVKTSITTVNLIIKNNGLRDIASPIVEPLLNLILSGKDMSKYNDFQAILKPLWNDNKQSVFIDGGFLVKTALNGGLAWNPIWGKVGPLFKDLVVNAWYKNIDSNLAAIGQDPTNMDPLSKTIYNALSNIQIPLGDNAKPLTINIFKLSNMFSFDILFQALKEIFVENEIQKDGQSNQSLLQQILDDLVDKKADITKWGTYLGYDNEGASKVEGYSDSYHYISANSILGNIYKNLYERFFRDNNPDKPDNAGFIIGTDDNKFINISLADQEDSDLVTRLNAGWIEFKDSLTGYDLKGIVRPLVDNANDSVWKISNAKNYYFKGTEDVQRESYELTFDSSSETVVGKDGEILPHKKAKYRISFSRIDAKSPFEFKNIEVLN